MGFCVTYIRDLIIFHVYLQVVIYIRDAELAEKLAEYLKMRGYKAFAFLGQFTNTWVYYIDGLVQERSSSSALAMELGLSCTNTSIFSKLFTC